MVIHKLKIIENYKLLIFPNHNISHQTSYLFMTYIQFTILNYVKDNELLLKIAGINLYLK